MSIFNYFISSNSVRYFVYTFCRPFFQGKSNLVDSGEVFLGLLDIRLDGLGTSLPVGRANLTVLISELESFNETKNFINGTTNGKIVDSNLTNGTLGVNDEETTESDTSFFNENTIVLGNGLGLISQERNVHLTKTTLLTGSVNPSKMREFYRKNFNNASFFFFLFFCTISLKLTRISRGTDNGSVQSFEFLDTFRESKDLSRANESEIHRIPEEDNVLALVVREGDILEFTIDDSGSSESGSLLLNLSDYLGDMLDIALIQLNTFINIPILDISYFLLKR